MNHYVLNSREIKFIFSIAQFNEQIPYTLTLGQKSLNLSNHVGYFVISAIILKI